MAETALAPLEIAPFGVAEMVAAEQPPEKVEETPPETNGHDADEAAAKEALEREARTKGWRSKEEFKGAPDRWAPADEYLDRYERVMPFVQRENHKLETALRSERERNEALERRLAAVEKENTERNQARAEIQQGALQSEYARAMEAGDFQAAARVAGDLIKVGVQAATVSRETPPPVQPPNPQAAQQSYINNLMQNFVNANPIFADERMQVLLAREIKVVKDVDPSLPPEQALEEARDRVQRMYSERFTPTRRTPAMAELGGAPSRTKNGVKTWADLKPDSAAQLDAFIKTTPDLARLGIDKARALVLKQADAEYFRA